MWLVKKFGRYISYANYCLQKIERQWGNAEWVSHGYVKIAGILKQFLILSKDMFFVQNVLIWWVLLKKSIKTVNKELEWVKLNQRSVNMFKKLYYLFSKVDYSKLTNFQKTITYLVHTGNIKKA